MPFCAWELHRIGGTIEYGGYWKKWWFYWRHVSGVTQGLSIWLHVWTWQPIPPLAIMLINNAFITILSPKRFRYYVGALESISSVSLFKNICLLLLWNSWAVRIKLWNPLMVNCGVWLSLFIGFPWKTFLKILLSVLFLEVLNITMRRG